jgi:hypothetical protein
MPAGLSGRVTREGWATASLSSTRKLSEAGVDGPAELVEKGNNISSNLTSREMMMQRDERSRQRYPSWEEG